MKKQYALLWSVFACPTLFSAAKANAQMFFSSSYDKGVKDSSAETKTAAAGAYDSDPDVAGIAPQIRDRLRLTGLPVIAKPDEVFCYGITRKTKEKSETISGYTLTGTCGSLNDEGLTAIKEKFFEPANFDMTTPKISAACVVKPKLLLRFRRGVDFVDVVLSGDKCPGLIYLYAGDSKEFYAKPMSEWLDNFITAVSNDLEPLTNEEETKKSQQIFIRKKSEEPAKEPEAAAPAEPEKPKVWGRRFN